MGDEGDVDADPSDTMRARVGKSRWKVLVLMNADRRVIAGGLMVLFFASLVALSLLDLSPLRVLVREESALWWVFSPMISAIVTGVTLVVTINQLVLSQELGPLGDQRERMQGATEFRRDVEDWLDLAVSPPDPASFLEAILDGVQTYGNELGDAADGIDDEDVREQFDQYVDSLTTHAEEAGMGLSDAQFGEFEVLYAALDFNYSWKIYEAERLKADHGDVIDEETEEALDDVAHVLEFFGPAREHFKTLYFEWELVNLSRMMLAASVPALVVTTGMMFYVGPGAFTGSTLGIDHLVLVLCAGTTVTLAPFWTLLAHILRIATTAKRTLAMGPFILRQTDRTDDIDWN